MNKFKKCMLERTNIESNKLFQRLSEKTQVLVPENGMIETAKNRLTHSYEVSTSALLIATDIADKLGVSVSDIDYKFSLHNVCLLHDIGQSPFGHDGQKIINDKIKEKGLEEGFDDNNNNLTVIEKNNIIISDYTMVSLIKYPAKLYSYQKNYYFPLLNKAIEEDKNHFYSLNIKFKTQYRTISCEIMDEADRNSYICSDLADFFCLGNSISLKEIKDFARDKNIELECSEFSTLANVIKSGSKTSIKAYFNDLKNRFNFNYTITENGLTVVNKDLLDYREFLGALEFKFFIRPKQKSEKNQDNLKLLENYIDYVFENNFFPSKTYSKNINNTKKEIDKLRYIRDMIGENTDWYIINFDKLIENKLKNKIC